MTLKWLRVNKTRTTNEMKNSNLICLGNKDLCAWRLVVGFDLMSENVMEISRYYSLASPLFQQFDWPIEQCFFSEKTNRALFLTDCLNFLSD